MTKKELALASASEAGADFAYYDRKEDEELSSDELRELLESGAVTTSELAQAFEEQIKELLNPKQP